MERLKKAFAAAKAELFTDPNVEELEAQLAATRLRLRERTEEVDDKKAAIQRLEKRVAELEAKGEKNLEEGLRERVLVIIGLLDINPKGSLKELVDRSVDAVTETVRMNGVLRVEITEARERISKAAGPRGSTLRTQLDDLLDRHSVARNLRETSQRQLNASEAKVSELRAVISEAERVLSATYPAFAGSLPDIIRQLEESQTEGTLQPPPWDGGASVVEHDGHWWWADETWSWHGPHSSQHEAAFEQKKYTALLDPERA